MAAGLIPVATDIGATSEIIEDNKNGYLIEADSSNKLFMKILYNTNIIYKK